MAKHFDIEAAGGVIVRRKKGRREVLVVHRPTHRDWSLPKGKLDAGETAKRAALREVAEETGLDCVLQAKLTPITYSVGSRSKRVRYWLMEPKGGKFRPNREVDRVEWLRPGKARKKLTYAHDVDVMTEGLRAHKDLEK